MLEAVPNISEGRRLDVVADVRAAIIAGGELRGGAGGVSVADIHSDVDHHRTVYTIFGQEKALVDALFAMVERAVELVDLREHVGVHPRIGACDVLPIVALGDGAAAVRVARELSNRVGDELAIPVLAYGVDEAGVAVEGAGFAGAVRRGGLDALTERMATGELVPVAGPSTPHPSAGVIMIGVRPVLVAFNVDLKTRDLDAAREIASELRALAGIRALAFELASVARVQVSTNVEQWQQIGPARVLEAVARAAAARGIEVHRAELVGLSPAAAEGQLRYACTKLGVPLAAASVTLDAALTNARRASVSDSQA